jgi:hypothetical protein
MQSKNCLQCNNQFFKKVYCSQKEWNTKSRFCSKTCADAYRTGKPFRHDKQFKKGQAAWNKGLDKSDPRVMQYALKKLGETNPMKRPEVQARSSKAHIGNYHPIEIRRQMSATQKKRVEQGLNNFYIDGRTKETQRQRNSGEYAIWREQVFKRDDYTCQDCGQRGGSLEAHHIFRWSVFKDLRFIVGNGITLCEECHEKTGSYKTKNSYQLVPINH